MEKCHFIGIGGMGMSGLAHIMLNKNVEVSGSDLAQNYVTENLINLGAKVFVGHSSQHILPGMTVVYSSDIKHENPEFQAAVDLKCPLMHRSEFLQMLMHSKRSLAVAGTHGKTTTSALLSWVFYHANQNPSFAIGGMVPQLKGNASYGNGDYFVAEACESDGSFLNYDPYGAIVTNVDFDHMDYYQSEEALFNAFQKFMSNVSSSEHLFWCGDDLNLKKVSSQKGISYGFDDHCRLKIDNFHQVGWKIFFDLNFNGKKYSEIEVSLTGRHNALNAAAVFGLAISLGLPEEEIREGLKSFAGVNRRCEKKGEMQGILFLDDYAHHPTEIRATLKAIRQAIGERRLVVVYQPHRYSRAKECMGMYQGVFSECDSLFITEIFAAGEAPIPEISHESIVQEVLNNKILCRFASRKDVAETLAQFIRPHDVVVTLGAGDITKVAFEILSLLKLKAPTKLKVGVIYGGASAEHEISLLSSKHILASLDPDLYDVEQFGITRHGRWITGDDTRKSLEEKHFENQPTDKIDILSPEIIKKLRASDILFPVLHGPNGEDGTMQGFFEMLNKAYVGCDYRSSAICMDKVFTKKLMQVHQIRTSPFVSFSHYQWQKNQKTWLEKIEHELSFPVFVKPIHLGSSIGVNKVETENGLKEAIEEAFRFDTEILIENGIVGRELEFAVLGNDEVTVFPPGEILTKGEMYSYEGKYSLDGVPTTAKAELSHSLIETGQQFVKQAYLALGCKGMARVDVFLDTKNQYWLNEVNPIPGFTANSLYPQMCAINGLSAQDLMNRLIILGLQRKREQEKLENTPL